MPVLHPRVRAGILACLCALFPAAPRAQDVPIDLARAHQYFEEARAICERDAGKLWGKSLCGPMLFVDIESRQLVANQPDREGILQKTGNVFTGTLPENENIANTATTWAGVKWTMIIWTSLGDTPAARARLMMHELFHRIQDEIGFPMRNPSNAHLDSLDGRYWLQLEWRALRRALVEKDAARRQAIADALTFRARRRQIFPQAAAEERALEMNEGLAEYTGVKLRGTPDAETAEVLARRMADASNRPTFVRSFAYESGPACSLLLDASGADWRKALKPDDDLGQLLQQALKLSLPQDLSSAAESRAKQYDGEALRASETERENARQKRISAYRARLVDGPVLILPVNEQFNYSFNPNELVPLDEGKTAFPTTRVTDAWGILNVTDGALLVREAGRVVRVAVAAPADPQRRPLAGPGWTLDLAPGWSIVPGTRTGDFRVEKQK